MANPGLGLLGAEFVRVRFGHFGALGVMVPVLWPSVLRVGCEARWTLAVRQTSARWVRYQGSALGPDFGITGSVLSVWGPSFSCRRSDGGLHAPGGRCRDCSCSCAWVVWLDWAAWALCLTWLAVLVVLHGIGTQRGFCSHGLGLIRPFGGVVVVFVGVLGRMCEGWLLW